MLHTGAGSGRRTGSESSASSSLLPNLEGASSLSDWVNSRWAAATASSMAS